MNFLGHIYLTPDNDQLLLGNFIADSVKGDPYRQYPKAIADGIKLHRAIDSYTDKHPLVKQGVQRFRATQKKYASVVIDVVYDHVLADNWHLFHDEELLGFTQSTYTKLEKQQNDFPEPVKRYFPYMKQQNWLYNYQYEWGLLKSLEGLDRRSSNDTQMHLAVEVYRQHKKEFLSEFSAFIEDAKKMVNEMISENPPDPRHPCPSGRRARSI